LAKPEARIQDVQLVLNRPFVTPNGSLWASDHIGLHLTLEMLSGK
jgi:hypothetical protein